MNVFLFLNSYSKWPQLQMLHIDFIIYIPQKAITWHSAPFGLNFIHSDYLLHQTIEYVSQIEKKTCWEHYLIVLTTVSPLNGI